MFNAFLLDSIDYVKLKWVDVISCHLEFDEQNTAIFSVSVPIHSALSTTRPQRPKKVIQMRLTQLLLQCLFFGAMGPTKKIYKADAQKEY